MHQTATPANSPLYPEHLHLLDIEYSPQLSNFGCGLATAEMILRALHRVTPSIKPYSQDELQQRLVDRRGKSIKDKPLPLRQISWLLRPVSVNWRRHPTAPRIRFDVIRKRLEAGQPVILQWEPTETDKSQFGHVTLCVGFVETTHGKGLIMLDPNRDADWSQSGEADEDLWSEFSFNNTRDEGRVILAYEHISRTAINSSEGELKWAYTGFLESIDD